MVRTIAIAEPIQVTLMERHLIEELDPLYNKHYRQEEYCSWLHRGDCANWISCRNGILSKADVASLLTQRTEHSQRRIAAVINGTKLELSF